MRIPLTPLLLALATLFQGAVYAGAPAGDWREPRQNPHLTALQPLPGAMAAAPEEWAAYDLGRTQATITPVAVPDGHVGLSIVAGTLYCHDTDGNLVWSSHPPGLNFDTLIRVADLDGDGNQEILLQAGRPASPYAAAVLVDLETGMLQWRYDVEPMSYGWYLYAGAYMPGRADQQIFVVMMGYPPDPLNGYCALFAFDGPGGALEQQWRYDFSEYTCFPGFFQSDLDHDGIAELVLETHSRMWYLDAVTGALKHFVQWDVSPGNVRSYGLNRFLDLNFDGRDDFLCIANFSQHHEVLLNQDGEMVEAWHHGWDESVTTGKVVSTWPEPPNADLDGDGAFEIVVSMYNSEGDNAWLVRAYDALDGTLKYTFPGVIAVRCYDIDGDGRAEILGNASADPTQTKLDGARVLSLAGDALAVRWAEDAATVTPAAGAPVVAREGGSFHLQGDGTGAIVLTPVTPVTPALPASPGPDFSKAPALEGPREPVLLAADLTNDGRNELLVFQNPDLTVSAYRDGSLTAVGKYTASTYPAIEDFNGDGLMDLALLTTSPAALPVVRVVTPAKGDAVLWETTLPETDRAGLPQPRRAYLRPIRLTGKDTPDLYVWAGTPLVRSVGMDGMTGAVLWEKGETSVQRYWGPSVNYASSYDYNGDGKEDLVFTNPDYYCIADGPTGDLLIGPSFPPDIFQKPSQGLYTYPAILTRAGETPEVCLAGGHYFQGGMSIAAEPYWHNATRPGDNRAGYEAFLTQPDGTWLMGFGRQNGKFACTDARTNAVRWEWELQATCSTVASGDVDGDGRNEFVFGTSHGLLMAAGDGGDRPRAVWAVEIGAAVWAPILADLDGDGTVEVICSTADGQVRVFGAAKAARQVSAHPRLYFTPAELMALRARKSEGESRRIWDNLMESAAWCLTQTPRSGYIAPVADDPIYENLYDRFYAMMKDMAVTEHLAFAYGLGGDTEYGEAARQWALASCRSWRPDADAPPDGGKAYAVLRLLKGVAVAYDLAYDRFSPEEREEVRGMLEATASNYYHRYFDTPEKMGPDFHTHHATVEFSSLGVVALALLGEAPEAQAWLDLTVKKFEEHLLPTGLAEDGAQVEGATFWASTMQYRLFFMDALRRVTGRDLYSEFKPYMRPELAYAQVAAQKDPGWNEADQTVIFSPSYGQLDYYAPVLLALAREYGDTTAQYLAVWDHSLGQLQQTRYICPNSEEQLLFELGGYAALWYDPSVAASPGDTPLSYVFPSVGEAYARSSWEMGGIVAGLSRDGQIAVHAGGDVVFAAEGPESDIPAEQRSVALADDGTVATLTARHGDAVVVTMALARPGRLLLEWSNRAAPLSFHTRQLPGVDGDRLTWENGVELRITAGHLTGVEPAGYAAPLVVGMGKLTVKDPHPVACPLLHATPDGGRLGIEIGYHRPES